MWERVTNWRFVVLVGVMLLDGVLFMVPLTAAVIVVAALAAPDGLRAIARFLDALAGAGRS